MSTLEHVNAEEIKGYLTAWLEEIPACDEPWFVGDLQRLKAISIVVSPLRFRMRKIFVLENFLSRA